MAPRWLRRIVETDEEKAAPRGATMVPLADVLTALQQPGQPAAPPNPMPRPEEWLTLPFNPGNPIYPAPVNPARPDTARPEPRVWEYPVAWNLRTTDGRLIPWKTLRDAADMPIIRQCITHRQKELTGLEWGVTISQGAIKEAEAEGVGKAEATDRLQAKLAPHIERLTQFWQTPDPEQGFEFVDWFWQVIEEQLVLDAVAIYPRLTYGGDLHALRTIDGSTIKPLLNDAGARPTPPHPAYQQVLYGFPRGEFTADLDADGATPGFAADQLIYRRRGVRTWTPYGFSPTEQALVDIDLYLKRHGWMRAEYTEGVTPETLLKILNGTPDQWTPRQIREYERALNDDLSGQTAERLRMRMLPPGTEPATMPSIPERYKPEYDLHLIKLVASHFAVPITELGFTEARGLGNSGLHQGNAEINYRKGLLPEARWWERLFTRIMRNHLGAPAELEFSFLGLDEEDEKDADAIANARVESGRMTINEDRDRLGLPRFPFPEADKPALFTAGGITFIEGAAEAAQQARDALAQGTPGSPGNSGEAPGNEASPAGEGGNGGQEGGGEQAQAAKSQLAAFRRWARKRTDPGRPFEFTADRDLLLKMAPDLADDDRVTWKAADAGPKDWPGWAKDEALAAHYAERLREALAGVVDWHQLAADWLTQRGATKAATSADPPDSGATQDARQWAETAGVFARIVAALRRVLPDAWVEAWLVGHRSAAAILAGEPASPEPPTPGLPELNVHARVDWSGWEPGNPQAARKLVGGATGLQDLLDHYGVATIRSVASTRMDELAEALAQALEDGSSVDQLAADLHSIIADPSRADMVAHTEIARAQSQASLDTYRSAGVDGVEWMIAPTDACPICTGNAEQGPIRRGQNFAGGVDAPPQHPRCRCAVAPVMLLGDVGKGWDPAAHPRGPDGKFIGRTEFANDAERKIGNAILADTPRRFTNAEASRWLRDHAPTLTDEQRSAVERYTGDGFREVNRDLRAGKTAASDVKTLDSAMKPTSESVILTRVVQPDAFGYKKPADVKGVVGRKVSDKAYMSTAAGSPYAGGLGGVTMHMVVPKGTPHIPVAAASENKHEREILLGRGLQMVVAKVEPNDRGGVDMYAIVLPEVGGTVDKAAKRSARQADADFEDVGEAPAFLLDPKVLAELFGEDITKAGGADRNRGNAENLRHWYVRGEGAAQIRWGEPGDFERCVRIAGEHVADPEGYCANRHKEATGEWPGREHKGA